MGYLHLDIKPDNILVSKKKQKELCMIDFGISEKFLNSEKKLIPRTERSYISGNLTFVSKFAFDFES